MEIKQAKEKEVLEQYLSFLQGWNQQDAAKMAASCATNCLIIGYDGSQMSGRQQIEQELGGIFSQHRTSAYVYNIRSVTFLHAQIAQIVAVVGMLAPGQKQVDPALNAIQVVTLVKLNGHWLIELLQNTPAQYHQRPELAQALTLELNQAANS